MECEAAEELVVSPRAATPEGTLAASGSFGWFSGRIRPEGDQQLSLSIKQMALTGSVICAAKGIASTETGMEREDHYITGGSLAAGLGYSQTMPTSVSEALHPEGLKHGLSQGIAPLV